MLIEKKRLICVIKTQINENFGFIHFVNFLFLGIITNWWFREGKLIGNVDIYYHFDKFGEFTQRFSNYSSIRGGGQNYATQVPGSFVTFFNWIINWITKDYLTSQKIYFIFINLCIFYSIYFFLVQLLKIERINQNRVIILFVCYLITFNPYLAFVWVRLQTNLFSLCWMFLTIGILLSSINNVKSLNKNFTLFTVISFFVGWTNGVQPPIFQIWIYTFIIVALYYSIKLGSVYQTFVFILKCSLSFLVTNLWWIYAFLNYVFKNSLQNIDTLSSQYNVYNLIVGTSKHLSLINLSRFIGDFAWFEDYLPNIFSYRTSVFFLLANSLNFVLILAYMILVSRRRKYQEIKNGDRFWFGALLTFLILSAGAHPPFGSIYLFFSDHIFALGLQRAPWQKFTMFLLLPFSFLTYKSIQFVVMLLRQVNNSSIKSYLTLTVFSLLIPISFLTVSGHMFNLGKGDYGFHETNNFGFHLETPEYINESIRYLNKQLDKDYGDIVLLPASKIQAYEWGYGAPVDLIVTSSIKSGVITPEYGEGTSSRMDIQESNDQMLLLLENGKLREFVKVANQRNVKYILNRRDFNLKFYAGKNKPDSDDSYTDLLTGFDDLTLLKSVGKWDIYKVNNSVDLVENIDHTRPKENSSLVKGGDLNFKRILPSLITLESNQEFHTIRLNEYNDSEWLALTINKSNQIRLYKNNNSNPTYQDNFGNNYKVNGDFKNLVLFYYPSFITYFLFFIAIGFVSIVSFRGRKEH